MSLQCFAPGRVSQYSARCSVRGRRIRATVIARYTDNQGRALHQRELCDRHAAWLKANRSNVRDLRRTTLGYRRRTLGRPRAHIDDLNEEALCINSDDPRLKGSLLEQGGAVEMEQRTVTIIPTEPGWRVVAPVNSDDGIKELYEEPIIAWRIETVSREQWRTH